MTAVNSGPGATLVNGVLKIVGTNGHDELQINKVGNQYQLVGCFLTPTVIRFTISQVQSIEIDMLGGNDHVNIVDSVTVPVTVRGGDGHDKINGGGGHDLIFGGAGNDDLAGDEGNDTIYGGDGDDELEGDDGNDLLFGEAGQDELEGDNGNDILSGGSGNDELEGDAGLDLLIGGLGADILKGDSDGDILVGNRVTFENDAVALQFVLAEWTSSRSYSSRVSNLRGTGTGTRLNGSVFLNSSTVLNDSAIDTLMGSSGQDWFLGSIGQDLFSGRAANEQIN